MTHALPSWQSLDLPAQKIRDLVWRGRSARVGETAVTSTFVHTFDPASPDCVGVVLGADAGRVFYHKAVPGQVVHIDVFHELGEVDHMLVARWLLKALEPYPGGVEMADLMDIQTGTGGGRLSGSLRFGKKPSLRRAHLNHVHIAAGLGPEHAEVIPWLVAGAECAVLDSGKQIRRVSQLAEQATGEGDPQDLSPYSTLTDSNLRGDPTERLIEEQQMLQSAMEMAEELGGVEEVERALDELASWEERRRTGSMVKDYAAAWQDQVEKLVSRGFARRDGKKVVLTDRGWELLDFLAYKSREIEMQFRRLLRRAPQFKPPRERDAFAPARGRKPGRSWGMRPISLESGEWPSDLAVAETVIAAFAHSPRQLSIIPEDLRTYRERPSRSCDVCLLIDASASMAGKRIRAAKYLAQHLLLASREKVSVVVFQEGSVKVEVPFTRNFGQIQAGLVRIQPMGLTPLAEGLVRAIDYVRNSRVKQPLLLLITDGIPTVPKWTLNPLEDSLTAAKKVAGARMRFGCIGLQPNKSFLQSLSRQAKGTLYVVDELEKETLANIAHRERSR